MSNLPRVRRISRLMKVLCTLALPAIPLVLAGMWATFDLWAASHPEIAHIRPLPDPMPGLSLVLGFAISMIPGGVAVYAVWRLRSLFGLYARGLIFTAENARCLRDFAGAVIAFAAAKPVAGALLSMALTYANQPGQRMLALRFGSAELVTLFIGCVFLVIAWIMDEGRELAEDQAQIV